MSVHAVGGTEWRRRRVYRRRKINREPVLSSTRHKFLPQRVSFVSQLAKFLRKYTLECPTSFRTIPRIDAGAYYVILKTVICIAREFGGHVLPSLHVEHTHTYVRICSALRDFLTRDARQRRKVRPLDSAIELTPP